MKSAGIKFVDGTKLDTLSSIPTINVTGNILSGNTNLNALFHKKVTTSVQTGIIINATTTSPTKGTTSMDKIFYRDNNDGTVTCRYQFRQTNTGTSGTGSYLFRLPSGYTFDTAIHVSVTDTNQANMASYGLGSGLVSNGGGLNLTSFIVPYNTNSFRISSSAYSYVGDSYFHLAQVNIGYSLDFTFYKG